MQIEVIKLIEVPEIEDCKGCIGLHKGSFHNECQRFKATLKDYFIDSKRAIKPCPACMDARHRDKGE